MTRLHKRPVQVSETALFSTFLLLSCSAVTADHPHGWSPSISLVDSASEPDGNGWCPDISGFGANINCNSMQTHSCKPQGGDTQFAYLDDPDTSAIYSVNFDGSCGSSGGGCMAVDGTIQVGATLKVQDCQDDSPQQRFVYTTSGYFRISSEGDDSYDLCLGVGESIRPAGRYYARDFVLVECNAVEDVKLIEWQVRPMPSYVMDDTTTTAEEEQDETALDLMTMMVNMTNTTNATTTIGNATNLTLSDVDDPLVDIASVAKSGAGSIGVEEARMDDMGGM